MTLMAVGVGLPLLRASASRGHFKNTHAGPQRFLKAFRRWDENTSTAVEHSINELCQALNDVFSRPQALALSFTMSLGQWGPP